MCLDDCVVKFNRYVVLTREARRLLMDYPWPGNYIQLRAFLERMVLTAPARTVNDGYVRSLLEELYPSRWSAPRGRPSPPPSPRGRPAGGGALPQRRQPGRGRRRAWHQQNHPLAADEAVWHPRPIRGADRTADRVRPRYRRGRTLSAVCYAKA